MAFKVISWEGSGKRDSGGREGLGSGREKENKNSKKNRCKMV